MGESEEQPDRPRDEHIYGHWHLLRDLLAFQFKLALDAIRDLMLSPVAIIAVMAGLISRQRDPGKYFHELLRLGHKTDRWINLFSPADRNESEAPDLSSDTYVRKVEDMVINEYKKGGLVRNIKDSTDGLIGKIRKE
jgi:hypothetical protein